MPSFADSIFLFVLALLLFGPKKLPVLARELGKWMGEFRRASNEFKMQMEDELRASEQADRQQKIAAMEAAAPIPPPLDEPPEPEHPHLRNSPVAAVDAAAISTPGIDTAAPAGSVEPSDTDTALSGSDAAPAVASATHREEAPQPLPIATSGSLKMMPPATGLPVPRSSRPNPLGGLVDAIPEIPANGSHAPAPVATEEVAHGD